MATNQERRWPRWRPIRRGGGRDGDQSGEEVRGWAREGVLGVGRFTRGGVDGWLAGRGVRAWSGVERLISTGPPHTNKLVQLVGSVH